MRLTKASGLAAAQGAGSFNGPKGVPTVKHMSALARNVFAEAEKMGMK